MGIIIELTKQSWLAIVNTTFYIYKLDLLRIEV